MTTKLSDLRMPCEHGKWGPHYFEMRTPLAVHREHCEGRGPLAEVSDLVEALQAETEVDDDWLIEGLVPVITQKFPSLSGSYAAPRELAAAILRELRQVVAVVPLGEDTV